jgi:hypothetical protein
VNERAHGTGVAARLLRAALGGEQRTCLCSHSMSEHSVSTPSTGSTPPGAVRPTPERDSKNNDGSAKYSHALDLGRRAVTSLSGSARPRRSVWVEAGTVWCVWTSEGKWLPNTERGRQIFKWCVWVGVAVVLVLIVVVGVQSR